MNERQALRSASRRLRHRSRSVASSVVLAAVAVAAAWVATESVLAALSRPPLLLAPGDMLQLIGAGGAWVTTGAVAAVVAGVVLLGIAVSPARRHRHELADDRAAWVIDDDVLAAGMSRAAARAAGVPPEQTTTAVGRRTAVIRVRPTSGFSPDADAAAAAARAALEGAAISPALRTRVVVEKQGVLA